MKIKMLKLTAAIVTLSVMTGCASIVGEREQSVTISSSPSNASVMITDERRDEVYSGTTPTTVQLRKSDGSYFGGKTYTVELSKEGYDNRSVIINSRPNGWYIGGNLVFGGLIGWFIVDPLTGAMYNLTPNSINATLGEKVVTTEDGGSEITLVLIEDVPAEMRNKMKYIGQM
ncbi:PEGA domain-containing protein [Halomonas halocynthiae]|uniref:PEGA domain-containing protein n=1 Tax=Halomonas halocynthiae TaxID=176290 RepID=UPI00040E2177|nr:PEGA domain-containing protein [Halomonas halocynthiae]